DGPVERTISVGSSAGAGGDDNPAVGAKLTVMTHSAGLFLYRRILTLEVFLGHFGGVLPRFVVSQEFEGPCNTVCAESVCRSRGVGAVNKWEPKGRFCLHIDVGTTGGSSLHKRIGAIMYIERSQLV
ncbi:MAG: hypothetical protein ABEK75_06535, partial [Salinibacter sp.]